MRSLLPLLAFASCVVAQDAPPTPPLSFTANITQVQGGQILHGFIAWDAVGKRTFEYVKEFEATTYQFQKLGTAEVYSYYITTSGCTCTVMKSAIIESYFRELASAAKNSTGCPGGGSGTYWANNAFPGLYGAAQSGFCFDGSTPVSMINGQVLTTFSNFKNSVVASDFPVEPIQSMIQACSSGCI